MSHFTAVADSGRFTGGRPGYRFLHQALFWSNPDASRWRTCPGASWRRRTKKPKRSKKKPKLYIKDTKIEMQQDFDRETAKRKQELHELERTILQRETALDKKSEIIDVSRTGRSSAGRSWSIRPKMN